MKRFRAMLASVVLCLFAAVFAAGCSRTPKVLLPDENTVVIYVSENQKSGTTLLDYMNGLKGDDFSFRVSDGMVTSINGVSNSSASGTYWMLYTSDKDNANDAWGLFEYEGERYGSATVGAGALRVKKGCYYIWAYQSI